MDRLQTIRLQLRVSWSRRQACLRAGWLRLRGWLGKNERKVSLWLTVIGVLIGVIGLYPIAFQNNDLPIPRDQFTELRFRLEVTEQALRTLFVILEQGAVPAEEWPTRLGEIAARHKQALKRLAVLETEDAEAQALLGQARTAIEAGNYGRAEGLLDRAEKRELANIERRWLSAAAIRAEQAELLLIQLRYREAAERFIAAAELVPDSKPEQRLAYRERSARALYHQGDEKGDNPTLKEAIRTYQNLLGEYPRERVPLQWATTQNNLGTALRALGVRESGTARLEEARSHIENAWRIYKDAGIEQYDEYFQQRLTAIDQLIAKRR